MSLTKKSQLPHTTDVLTIGMAKFLSISLCLLLVKL